MAQRDLQVQMLRGQPVLTYYVGRDLTLGVGAGDYVIEDASYNRVAIVHAGNGYKGDLHEFTLTPWGSAVFLVYSPVLYDTRAVEGGGRAKPVFDAIVQEVDVATGLVLFEWHSLGNVALTESYQELPEKGSTLPYDYVHPNSVAPDDDGAFLVSARHTSTVYKIDRTTGAIEWRLGGKKSDFKGSKEVVTAWQHHVRRSPDGTVTIFDNGASNRQKTRGVSRGLVVRLDEKAHTAKLVKEYPGPGKLLATSQGSFEALPNGNYFAGWGSEPVYTEFDPAGSIVYQARLPAISA